MKRTAALFAETESLIIFGIIVILTIIAAWVIGNYFQKKIVKRLENQNEDITSILFIKHAIRAIVYLFGFGWAFLILPISKTYAHSLFAGAGASTLILGIASQQILGNLISGIYLVLKKPYRINDIITVAGCTGKVIELNLHDTILEDDEDNVYIVPNTLIANGVITTCKRKK